MEIDDRFGGHESLQRCRGVERRITFGAAIDRCREGVAATQ
jgi:hypothetical protein